MWDLIVSVPDHCLSFYLEVNEVRPLRSYFDGPQKKGNSSLIFTVCFTSFFHYL